MTTKTAAKKSAPKTSTKTAKPPAPLAKRSATGKTPAEALGKLDFKGLAREAADKLKAKAAASAAPSPASVAPEPKPEASAPAATPKAAATRSVVPADAKITCLMKENPSRPGTTAWKVRELYRTCKTVGDWRERAADLDLGYLQHDIRGGLIRVG
jgi:hypothetical protein